MSWLQAGGSECGWSSARPELVTSANWSSAMVSMINDLILGQRNGTPQGGIHKAARESTMLFSTDPLVTSAAYILFIMDQKGIFHGSAFIGCPYFPEMSSHLCSQGKNMGVITASGCPSRHRVLCGGLYVDFKAGRMRCLVIPRVCV